MEFHRIPQLFGRTSNEIYREGMTRIMTAMRLDGRDADTYGFTLEMFADLQCASLRWPYYKVWPEYLDMFKRTRLDNAPLSSLTFPFKSWHILLPKNYVFEWDEKHLAGIGVHVVDGHEVPALLHNAAGDAAANIAPALAAFESASDVRQLMLQTSWWEADVGDYASATASIRLDELYRNYAGLSVEDAIRQYVDKVRADDLANSNGHDLPDYCTKPAEYWSGNLINLLRVAMSVAFIATGEYKFVQRDVLTDDTAKYLAAMAADDQATITRLGDKADRRRASLGHTIGKFHAIDVLRQQTEPAAGETEEQRELRNQHLRSGHFHAYWCGPGRTERKVRFLAPVIVRPDLPPPSTTPARLIRPQK